MTELTHHTFEFELGHKKIVRELDVPFTAEEIQTLESLHNIRSGWAKDAMHGSGLARELYANLVTIPWGTALIDREASIDRARRTITNIRSVREKFGALEDFTKLSGDLSTIEDGLLKFVPDLREENK